VRVCLSECKCLKANEVCVSVYTYLCKMERKREREIDARVTVSRNSFGLASVPSFLVPREVVVAVST